MKFEWDFKKAGSNQQKHGISFEEAVTVFDDPHGFIAPDHRHSVNESRALLIGEADSRKLIVVAFTERAGITRLISARPTSRKERKIYESLKRISV